MKVHLEIGELLKSAVYKVCDTYKYQGVGSLGEDIQKAFGIDFSKAMETQEFVQVKDDLSLTQKAIREVFLAEYKKMCIRHNLCVTTEGQDWAKIRPLSEEDPPYFEELIK